MSSCNHCSGFTRSQMLRHSVAQAGQGIRAIEPGMPLPAGTGLTRRTLIARGGAGALAVYGASRLGLDQLREGIAAAATGPPSQRALVSVFLPGGLDSLSLLAPVGDPRYAQLRPSLALAAGSGPTFTEDNRLMWAPQAAGLHTLHGEGKVTVIPAVGYDHPDQSHFTSRHFWEVGATDVQGRFGWMGRFLDLHGVADNPLQGLSLDWALSPALAASNVPVAAVARPDDFSLWGPGVGDPILDPMYEAIGNLGRLPTEDPQRRVARLVATEVDDIRRTLGPFQAHDGLPGFTSPVVYPDNDFANRLAALAAMLAAGVPIRCVAIDAPGGYDTHSNQASSLGDDIQTVSDALLAFQRDLEARGIAGRVLTQVWSEFGRRPEQNDTGTDHGAGGLALVIGSQAKGQQVGEFPGLATLDDGDNLVATADFRGVYCSLLEQWFGVDAAPIIPGAASFTRPALVA
jgi:uncharacterized protein (DUF1501 family)